MKRDGWIQDNIIPDGCWKDLWMAQTGLYWKIMRQCETDLPHDFIESEEGIELRFLRLTIEEVPFYVPPCISGLRVFGKSSGEKPS